jgi:hypothetical protein
MRERDVRGKTILRVLQDGPMNANGAPNVHEVKAIYFDDGSRLSLYALETEDIPIVCATYYPRKAQDHARRLGDLSA